MLGWAKYFQLGQVSPAYRAVDAHAIKRLRQWLCRKHKVRSGKYVRYPDNQALGRPGPDLPCPADGQPPVGEGMISSESRDALCSQASYVAKCL